jgi:hypothetical protein
LYPKQSFALFKLPHIHHHLTLISEKIISITIDIIPAPTENLENKSKEKGEFYS